MTYDFVQVDAFSRRPLYGNPAAVVFDADNISTETMQKIAREMNLSETVFILKPTTCQADYRARIFSPMSELPFAGHPTLAAAHSILDRFQEKADAAILRQECGIGIINVKVIRSDSSLMLRMTQAEPTYQGTGLTTETLAKMLGCGETDFVSRPAEMISTGVPWLIAELSSVTALSQLNPDQGLIARQSKAIKAAGITVFAEHKVRGAARIRVRTFAPGEGVSEDPVCGSGNGSVAAYIARHKNPRDIEGAYVAEQGIEIGRDGLVYASWKRHGEHLSIHIGGEAVIAARGKLYV